MPQVLRDPNTGLSTLIHGPKPPNHHHSEWWLSNAEFHGDLAWPDPDRVAADGQVEYQVVNPAPDQFVWAQDTQASSALRDLRLIERGQLQLRVFCADPPIACGESELIAVDGPTFPADTFILVQGIIDAAPGVAFVPGPSSVANVARIEWWAADPTFYPGMFWAKPEQTASAADPVAYQVGRGPPGTYFAWNDSSASPPNFLVRPRSAVGQARIRMRVICGDEPNPGTTCAEFEVPDYVGDGPPVLAADPRPPLPPPLDRDPATLNAYQRQLYSLEKVLHADRPAIPEPGARHQPLLDVKSVALLGQATPDAAMHEFGRRQAAVAATELVATAVPAGAVVFWKIYNMGFVVRSRSATLAFDLVRGYGNDVPDHEAVIESIIDQTDILFLSHNHGDHVDPWVVDAFEARGKPVVTWNLTRSTSAVHEQTLASGVTLRFVALPGHQSNVGFANTPFIVMLPDGVSVAHTGDQSFGDDLAWLDRVNQTWSVDVLFFNIWAPQAARMVAGFKPAVAVCGHEYEMGHGIEQRKPYDHFYDFMKSYSGPTLVTAWGESYVWSRSTLDP